MDNWEIGDIVEVTNNYSVYDMYKTMAEIFGMKNWKRFGCPENGDICKVVNIIDGYIGIKDVSNGNEYIIGKRGIKKYIFEEFITESEFSI